MCSENKSSEVLGQLTVDLDANKDVIRASESPLCNLVTDAVLAYAKTIDPEVKFAITNAGGVRFDSEKRPDGIYPGGDFTEDMVAEILPFGNTLVIIEITGAELREAFEHGASALPAPMGFFAQCSKGTVYTVNVANQAEELSADEENPEIVTHGERVVSVTIDGIEVADTDVIKIATSDYIADGKDGYVTFGQLDDSKKHVTGIDLKEALFEYIKEAQPIGAEVDGRIVIH